MSQAEKLLNWQMFSQKKNTKLRVVLEGCQTMSRAKKLPNWQMFSHKKSTKLLVVLHANVDRFISQLLKILKIKLPQTILLLKLPQTYSKIKLP